ncbi:MAG TPA: hypothetical protein VG756_23090 [Pseudonocardiaceae bacterium]|jgi:DNA-binding transcriptional LysR family regulator|nr:hypothetical protein [Pseudonocardiaceae bacterium]
MASGKIGTITIGFEATSAYFGTLGPITATFRHRHPGITVQLTSMNGARREQSSQR